MHAPPNGIRRYYESLDRERKQRGMLMDLMGLGPIQSPSQTIWDQPGLRLHFYGGRANGPLALIVPAPIKRHYIWDLSPQRSVVRHALAQGLRVYLIEWTDPCGESADFGLGQYGYELIDRCVETIRNSEPPDSRRAKQVFLLSHSLGGILSALYAALRPERVAGLVLLEAPLHFAEACGSFTPLVAFGPSAASVTQWFDTVPGSLLSMVSVAASPTSFSTERYADFIDSLASPETLEGHLLVQRWTLDEASMSRRLFEEVVEQLYREDRFMQGRLTIDGRRLGPADVIAPMLSVLDPRSLIIPPASIIEFQKAAASAIKRLLPYHGDKGIALSHVGVLVGRNAHEKLWPAIFDWVKSLGVALH